MRNIGELDPPLLVFGGPYSNLEATQAMQRVANARGIKAKNIICTGDIVAYCASPEQTVDLVKSWNCHVVMGNCEESIGMEKADCGCGFEPGSLCETLSKDWYLNAARSVSPKNKSWMQSLPRRINFKMNDLTFSVIHGGAGRIDEFIFNSTNSQKKTAALDQLAVDCVIGGHCGIPFGQNVDDRYWLNAGVIGMPANDGQTSTWYMSIEEFGSGLVASWHRLEYDYNRTVEFMRDCSLLDAYQITLATGIWPSMSILPEHEQSRQGSPLNLLDLPLTG